LSPNSVVKEDDDDVDDDDVESLEVVDDVVGVRVFGSSDELLSGGLLRGLVPSRGFSAVVFSHHVGCGAWIHYPLVSRLPSLASASFDTSVATRIL